MDCSLKNRGKNLIRSSVNENKKKKKEKKKENNIVKISSI